MVILVHVSGFELERDLRNDVQEKIELALGRFERQIGKVNVYLADLNGPKKGVDKSIRLVIDIERQPRIAVGEKGEDWLALLESISDRASHTVSRQLDRSRVRKGRTSLAGDQESNEDSIDLKRSDYSDQTWNPLIVRPE
jgi:putative sigma-54 modulation protein